MKGVRYFECEENYGSFVRPKGLEQGDFPEVDIALTDDDEV